MAEQAGEFKLVYAIRLSRHSENCIAVLLLLFGSVCSSCANPQKTKVMASAELVSPGVVRLRIHAISSKVLYRIRIVKTQNSPTYVCSFPVGRAKMDIYFILSPKIDGSALTRGLPDQDNLLVVNLPEIKPTTSQFQLGTVNVSPSPSSSSHFIAVGVVMEVLKIIDPATKKEVFSVELYRESN